MSEYQYYEFQAIDRPLDERAMAALRSITSRARITPTSLVNVYHFGDFKGNPDRLMDQYFDAHLYVANWGTRRLMLRLGARSLSLALAKPYAVPNVLNTRTTKDHIILDFHSENDEVDEDFDDGEDWLASLISLRSDLLAGDYRCLYLGWLAGVQNGDVNDDAPEPSVPPGLRQLSASLQRFVDFLCLDTNLVEVAAEVSAEWTPINLSTKMLATWVAKLPPKEKDSVVIRLLQGEGVPLASELIQRFRKDQANDKVRNGREESSVETRRIAGELIEARDRLAEEEKRKTAERVAKEEIKRARDQAAARVRHLDNLVGKEEEIWRQIEVAIKTKQPKQYDHAVELLNDLCDLAQRTDNGEVVAGRVRELRERHRNKSTLMLRMDRAELP